MPPIRGLEPRRTLPFQSKELPRASRLFGPRLKRALVTRGGDRDGVAFPVRCDGQFDIVSLAFLLQIRNQIVAGVILLVGADILMDLVIRPKR